MWLQMASGNFVVRLMAESDCETSQGLYVGCY